MTQDTHNLIAALKPLTSLAPTDVTVRPETNSTYRGGSSEAGDQGNGSKGGDTNGSTGSSGAHDAIADQMNAGRVADPMSGKDRHRDCRTVLEEERPSLLSTMWKVFHSDDVRPLSLRAIWPRHLKPSRPVRNVNFTARSFPTAAERRRAFEAKASELNAEGYNVYVVMNPIREDFKEGAVRDADIAFRDLLLIDIDRAGATDCPASDDEINAASALADQVSEDPALEGLELRARVMSGNGVHLYYALPQMPNEEVSKLNVQETLQLLAWKFDNDAVKIDQSVFNASRITKVPGTVARKGEVSGGRPYRVAQVIWP